MLIALKCKIPVYQNSKLANISNIFDCLCAVSTNQTDEPPCRATHTHTHTPSFPSASPCPPATFKCGGNFLVPGASRMTIRQGVGEGGSGAAASGPNVGSDFMLYNFRYANGKQRLALCQPAEVLLRHLRGNTHTPTHTHTHTDTEHSYCLTLNPARGGYAIFTTIFFPSAPRGLQTSSGFHTSNIYAIF